FESARRLTRTNCKRAAAARVGPWPATSRLRGCARPARAARPRAAGATATPPAPRAPARTPRPPQVCSGTAAWRWPTRPGTCAESRRARTRPCRQLRAVHTRPPSGAARRRLLPAPVRRSTRSPLRRARRRSRPADGNGAAAPPRAAARLPTTRSGRPSARRPASAARPFRGTKADPRRERPPARPHCSFRRLGGDGADPDPGQPLVSSHHLPPSLRRAVDEVTWTQRPLLAVDTQHAAAANHGIDLLLVVPAVVMLRPFRARCQLQLVDPEAGDAELIRQRAEDAVLRLHVAGVNHLRARAHHSSFLATKASSPCRPPTRRSRATCRGSARPRFRRRR